MASLKAEKPAGTQLFGQPKKEPAAKASEGASKVAGSKSAAKKSAQKPQEPKKKVRSHRLISSISQKFWYPSSLLLTVL